MQEAELRKQLEESKHAEDIADDAAAEEERAKEAARKAAEEAKLAKDEESKRRAKEAEKKALAEARQNKEKKLRMQLKAATNSRKVERIKGAIKDAKEAKMPGNLCLVFMHNIRCIISIPQSTRGRLLLRCTRSLRKRRA